MYYFRLTFNEQLTMATSTCHFAVEKVAAAALSEWLFWGPVRRIAPIHIMSIIRGCSESDRDTALMQGSPRKEACVGIIARNRYSIVSVVRIIPVNYFIIRLNVDDNMIHIFIYCIDVKLP